MGDRWINDGCAAIPVWGGFMVGMSLELYRRREWWPWADRAFVIGMGILVVDSGAWCAGVAITLHRRWKRDAEKIGRG